MEERSNTGRSLTESIVYSSREGEWHDDGKWSCWMTKESKWKEYMIKDCLYEYCWSNSPSTLQGLEIRGPYSQHLNWVMIMQGCISGGEVRSFILVTLNKKLYLWLTFTRLRIKMPDKSASALPPNSLSDFEEVSGLHHQCIGGLDKTVPSLRAFITLPQWASYFLIEPT